MTEDINKMSKKELIDVAKNWEDMYFQGMKNSKNLLDTICNEHKENIETLMDTIGSLQEQNELLHHDLAVQIHWRMKLEEEILNYGKTSYTK